MVFGFLLQSVRFTPVGDVKYSTNRNSASSTRFHPSSRSERPIPMLARGSRLGQRIPQSKSAAARSFWSGRHSSSSSRNTNSGGRRGFGSLPPVQSASVPGPDGIPSRSEQIESLRKKERSFDVLVIGGGATGCGVALDAARRGLDVACIERGDFGGETSSRSTKLVWAGIRYLGSAVARLLNEGVHRASTWESFVSELRMVRNCHRERKYMLETQRHLTHWMPIAVPFTGYFWVSTKDEQPPPFGNSFFLLFPALAPFVFKLYDSLSGFTCPHSYVLSQSSTKKVFPQLDSSILAYVGVFYEAMHNDARTNLAIAMTAAREGATMANHVEAVRLLHKDKRVVGAVLRDNVTGNEFEVQADRIVLAGGPFTDSLRKMESPDGAPAVRGSAGTHIVVPKDVIPADLGMLDFNTSDGRFLFVLPWQNHTLIGTTDVPCSAETRHYPPVAEIDYLLREAGKYLQKRLGHDDVLSAWRGWRPLAVDPHAPPGAPVSRDHVISENPESGVLFVAGGKWTTWREMAEEVVDRVSKQTSDTISLVLYGGEDGYSDRLVEDVQERLGFDESVAQHLVDTYGVRVWEVTASLDAEPAGAERFAPGFPYIRAEIGFACQEYACTVEDILSQRTRLAYLNKHAAIASVPIVADEMQKHLGWSNKIKTAQIRAALEHLDSFGGVEP